MHTSIEALEEDALGCAGSRQQEEGLQSEAAADTRRSWMVEATTTFAEFS